MHFPVWKLIKPVQKTREDGSSNVPLQCLQLSRQFINNFTHFTSKFGSMSIFYGFFFFFFELCNQMRAFRYSCLIVWTHKETEIPSLCRNKARMLEGLLLLHHLPNQLRFKWNSVGVTDMIFFFFKQAHKIPLHFISGRLSSEQSVLFSWR